MLLDSLKTQSCLTLNRMPLTPALPGCPGWLCCSGLSGLNFWSRKETNLSNSLSKNSCSRENELMSHNTRYHPPARGGKIAMTSPSASLVSNSLRYLMFRPFFKMLTYGLSSPSPSKILGKNPACFLSSICSKWRTVFPSGMEITNSGPKSSRTSANVLTVTFMVTAPAGSRQRVLPYPFVFFFRNCA